jgi:hypothetical protein
LVADFVCCGVEIQIAGRYGAPDDGRCEDAHQEQHDDYLDDSETGWTSQRIYLD